MKEVGLPKCHLGVPMVLGDYLATRYLRLRRAWTLTAIFRDCVILGDFIIKRFCTTCKEYIAKDDGIDRSSRGHIDQVSCFLRLMHTLVLHECLHKSRNSSNHLF